MSEELESPDSLDPGWRHIGGSDKDLYECVDCGARRLPGVSEDDHEPGCRFGDTEEATE